MAQKETKIYLNYLSKDEKENMTNILAFLRTNDDESKENLIKMAAELYAKDKTIRVIHDNGRAPSACSSFTRCKDKKFWTIVEFKKENLTPQALKLMGQESESDKKYGFWYYYAISLCDEDRELYLTSFQDKCSPNWNGEYCIEWCKKLGDINFVILQENATIYRMDNALHAAINDKLAAMRPMFVESEGRVVMTVRDQHGNYCDIEGSSLEEVFRNYADNYTGYRDYRRQMASEWEIADDGIRQKYEEWKQTAKGLKSSFDKFYGGGIVD